MQGQAGRQAVRYPFGGWADGVCLCGSMTLREQEALRERDLRQVYDTSIKVNLEELALQEALALVHAQVRSFPYSPFMP